MKKLCYLNLGSESVIWTGLFLMSWPTGPILCGICCVILSYCLQRCTWLLFTEFNDSGLWPQIAGGKRGVGNILKFSIPSRSGGRWLNCFLSISCKSRGEVWLHWDVFKSSGNLFSNYPQFLITNCYGLSCVCPAPPTTIPPAPVHMWKA